MMENKIQVGLIEDQFLFRECLKGILNSWPDMEVVFESSEGYTVIDKLLQSKVLPQVMLVDLSLPTKGQREYNGLQVTDMLSRHFPEMKVLILSLHEEEELIVQLIEHGAHGYLVKDCYSQEVHDAIVAAHNNGTYINERTFRAIQNNLGKKKKLRNPLDTKITKREEEILQLVCQQLTAEEIGDKLYISAKTVNAHKNNLLVKTGSRNVTGLVIYAVKNHLVELI